MPTLGRLFSVFAMLILGVATCFVLMSLLIGAHGLRAKLGPFHTAIDNGDVASVERFLRLGTPVDEPTSQGETGLEMAVVGKDWRIADLLVRHGADLNRSQSGRSMLYDMVLDRNRPGYEWLLRHGARRDEEAEYILKTPERRWRD